MKVTVTTFGSAEWLRHIGLVTDGELVFHDVTPRPPLVSEIQRAVAAQFGIDIREMKSARRARAVARPRQVAMYLSRELTPKSLPEIGRLFGNRDHTTVIHACRQIEKCMIADVEMKASVNQITADLRA